MKVSLPPIFQSLRAFPRLIQATKLLLPAAPACRNSAISAVVLAAVAVVALFASHSAQAATDGTWTGAAGTADWATSGNWTAFPTFDGRATFNAAAGTGGAVINLGTSRSTGGLIFNTSNAAAYTIGAGAVGSQTLQLNAFQGTIIMNSTVTNDQLINAKLNLGNGAGSNSFTITNNSTTNLLTFAGAVGVFNTTVSNIKETVTFTGAGNITVSGAIQSTVVNFRPADVIVKKTGTGTLTLTGANTYTGATTVSLGTLLVNNNTGSGTGTGTVAISGGATLGGSGTIAGATIVEAGSVLSPGNSTGNLTFNSDLTLAGTYKWELAALSSSDPGVDFDTVTITNGDADITGASIDLALGGFAPTNVAFWQTNQIWTGILNNTGAGTLTGSFAAIDNSSWSTLGNFSTLNVDNDVNLVWTPVPEPNTFLLAFTGLGILLLGNRMRRGGRG